MGRKRNSKRKQFSSLVIGIYPNCRHLLRRLEMETLKSSEDTELSCFANERYLFGKIIKLNSLETNSAVTGQLCGLN